MTLHHYFIGWHCEAEIETEGETDEFETSPRAFICEHCVREQATESPLDEETTTNSESKGMMPQQSSEK